MFFEVARFHLFASFRRHRTLDAYLFNSKNGGASRGFKVAITVAARVFSLGLAFAGFFFADCFLVVWLLVGWLVG